MDDYVTTWFGLSQELRDIPSVARIRVVFVINEQIMVKANQGWRSINLSEPGNKVLRRSPVLPFNRFVKLRKYRVKSLQPIGFVLKHQE